MYIFLTNTEIFDHFPFLFSEQQSLDDIKCEKRVFDVIFMHCDVDVEKTWVIRVVEKLEKKYSFVCGLMGRDFPLGFQIQNISSFIEKHTTVVVTFSEKSERTHPAIGIIEDIEKIVVVMVEDCSLPIVCTNMKCVDATLDETMWLKQLFKALDYKTDAETYVSMC